MDLSRRKFIKASAAVASTALIEIGWPHPLWAADDLPVHYLSLKLLPGNGLLLKLERPEIGQGVSTMLATLVAVQLKVDPSSILFESVEAGSDPSWQGYQAKPVGGSNSTRSSWEPVREMASAFADLFIRAAAQQLNVDVTEIRLFDGLKVGTKSRQLSFEALAPIARELPLRRVAPGPWPADIVDMPRVDAANKINGSEIYGIDAVLPGMRSAVIQRRPLWADSWEITNREEVIKAPGVDAILDIPTGVAIIAASFWQAEKARRALTIQWRGERDDKAVSEQYRQALNQNGIEVHRVQRDVANSRGDDELSVIYRQPFAAQCPMEPLSCLAHIRGDDCEVWVSTQRPQRAREFAAITAGVPLENVTVHCLPAGGGFGRRLESDFVVEAVYLARKVGTAVKLYWSRQDELQGGSYRPGVWVQCQANYGADGKIHGLNQALVGPGVLWRDYPLEFSANADSLEGYARRIKAQWIDPLLVKPQPGEIKQGLEFPYTINFHRATYQPLPSKLPAGYWRGVGHNHNTFAMESLVDEVAARVKRDPLQLRLDMASDERLKRLLVHARDAQRWTGSVRQGCALFCGYDSYIVIIVNLARGATPLPAIDSIWCGVDCGQVINPDIVRQQIEGGCLFGLSAALREEVRFERGEVMLSNFDNYPILAMTDAPAVDVELLPSDARPGGVGELAVPAVAPALCNAIFRLTGQRIRTLPVVRHFDAMALSAEG